MASGTGPIIARGRIEITPDLAADFRSRLEAAVGRQRPIPVRVAPQVTGTLTVTPRLAANFARLAQRQIDRIRPPLTVTVTPQLNRGSLAGQLRGLSPSVNVNTTGANRQLAGTASQFGTRVHTALLAALTIRALPSNPLDGLANKATGLLGAATAATGAVAGLGAALAGVGAAGAIAGAGVGAFAALAAPQITAVTTATTAVAKAQTAYDAAIAAGDTKGATKALEDQRKALGALTPAQRAATQATLDLRKQFTALSNAQAGTVLSAYTSGVRTLSGLLPLVGQLSAATGTALSAIFARANAGVAAAAGPGGSLRAFVDLVAGQIGPVLDAAASAAVNLGVVVSNVFHAALPLISPVLGLITGLTGQLRAASAGAGLGGFFTSLAPAVTALAPALTAAARAIGALLSAAAPLAGPVLGAVTALGTALTGLLSSADFRSFVASVASVITQLSPLFAVLAGALGKVAATLAGQFAAVLPSLIPVVVQLANVFANVLVGLSPLLPVFAQLALAVISLLPVLYPLIIALRDALAPVITAVANALIAATPIIAAIVGVIAQILPVVGKAAGALLDLGGKLLRNVAPALDGAKKAGEGFLSGWKDPAAKVAPGVGGLQAVFQRLGGGVHTALSGLAGGLSTIGRSIATSFGPQLSRFGDTLTSKILPDLGGFASTVASSITPVLGTLGDVLSTKVIPILGDLFGWFANDILPILVKVWTGVQNALIPAFATVARVITDVFGYALGKIKKILDDHKGQVDAVITAFGWLEVAMARVDGFIVTYLAPVFGFVLKRAIDIIAFALGAVLDVVGLVIDIFRGLAAAAGWVAGIASAAAGLIASAWGAMISGIAWAWNNVLRPAWDAVALAARWLYDHTLSPVFSAIGSAWGGLSSGISWAYENVMKPVWGRLSDGLHTVQTAFATVKDAIGKIWGGLADTFKAPVNAVFGFINDHLLAPLQNVTGKFGLDIYPQYKLPAFAAGGIAPGDRPILVGEQGPELVTLGRTSRIYPTPETGAMLAGPVTGSPGGWQVGGVGGFPGSGILGKAWDATTSAVSGAWDGVVNIGGKIIEFGRGLAGKAVSGLFAPIRALLAGITNPMPEILRGLLSGIPNTLMDKIVDWVKGVDNTDKDTTVVGGGDYSGALGGAVGLIVDVMRKSGLPFAINSTSGGEHAVGSYHYSGNAVDFGGDLPAIAGYWDRYAGSLLELIYGDGWKHNVKNGRDVGDGMGVYGPAVMALHSGANAHVHIAGTADAMRRILAGGTGRDVAGPVAAPVGDVQNYARALLAGMGWADQWDDFARIVARESGWNPHARNPDSGAYGIPQALPPEKMASAGADWRDNPDTQLRWMVRYIADRWHDPRGAWANEVRAGWYRGGGLARGWSVIGDAGPELVNVGSPSRVLTNADSRAALGRTTGPLIGTAIIREEADAQLLADRLDWLARAGTL